MKVVLINGMPQAGKDLFCKMCIQEMGSRVRSFSTVDYVKEIAKNCGWNGIKTPETRKFLSDLKDLLSNCPWGDLPIKDVEKHIRQFAKEFEDYDMPTTNCVAFVHVREPQNLEKLKQIFNAKTLLLRRDCVEGDQSNHADAEVFDFDYDFVIENNGTKDELYNEAVKFLKTLGVHW